MRIRVTVDKRRSDEVGETPSASVLTNVFGGDDVVVVFCGNAGAVNAGAESRGCNAIDPRENIGFLLGEHASALLLVEEDDRLFGESLTACGHDGGVRVRLAEAGGVGDGFQFGIKAPVEEDEESEAGGFNCSAVADPGVRFLAGRIVEPVSRVGKSLAQSFQVGVAGIVVAVEAEVWPSLSFRC